MRVKVVSESKRLFVKMGSDGWRELSWLKNTHSETKPWTEVAIYWWDPSSNYRK
jgi:hypothetical protein